MQTQTRRVTLGMLAKELGVTPNTVSAALRDTGRISETKRKEIKMLAAELGYRPHLGAQSLRSKRTRHIGLLLSADVVAYGFQNPILRALASECQAHGLRYQVEWCHPGQKVPSLVTEGMIDGIIVGGKMGPAMCDWLARSCHIPYISLAEPGPYAIQPDAAANQRKVIDFLYSLGHRSIGLLALTRTNSTYHKESIQPFRKALQNMDLAINEKFIIRHEDKQTTGNRQPLEAQLHSMLRQPKRPTAFVCMGLNLAQVLVVAALRANVAIPYELSIIVHTAEHMAAEAYPRYSVLDPDSELMTRKGLEKLNDLLEGKEVSHKPVRVPGRIVGYDTTASVNIKK